MRRHDRRRKIWNTILDAGLKHDLIFPVVLVEVLRICGLITAAVINGRMSSSRKDGGRYSQWYLTPTPKVKERPGGSPTGPT